MASFDELPSLLNEMQQKLINELSSVALVHGANVLVSEMKQRIFAQGLTSDGVPITLSYSTTPVYVSKDVFVRKSSYMPKGVKNKGNFKNGNERKTMYLEHGYKELREIQGRQTNHVDLRYSGSLEKSIEVLREDERNVLVAITDGLESTKRKGLEEHYGVTIFKPAQKELKLYEDTISDEVDRITAAL